MDISQFDIFWVKFGGNCWWSLTHSPFYNGLGRQLYKSLFLGILVSWIILTCYVWKWVYIYIFFSTWIRYFMFCTTCLLTTGDIITSITFLLLNFPVQKLKNMNQHKNHEMLCHCWHAHLYTVYLYTHLLKSVYTAQLCCRRAKD